MPQGNAVEIVNPDTSSRNSDKRIDRFDQTVIPAMFEVFRIDHRATIVLGISPKVRIDPGFPDDDPNAIDPGLKLNFAAGR